MKYLRKEPFPVGPKGEALCWPKCEHVKYVAGKRLQCIHENGMGHRGECVFPKEES